MAQITAQCPHCKQQFNAQADWIGQQTNCPNCGNNFVISEQGSENLFLHIVKQTKTLIPDIVLLGIFLLLFIIYLYGLFGGLIKISGTAENCENPCSIVDAFKYNVPFGVVSFDYFGCMRFDTFVDFFLLFALLGCSVCYLIFALLNKTIFEKIQIISASICVALTSIILLLCYSGDMGFGKGSFLGGLHRTWAVEISGYMPKASIVYSYSTILYVFILLLATISFSVWMKYKLYLQECSNGEKIEFMDFIKKLLKWDMV